MARSILNLVTFHKQYTQGNTARSVKFEHAEKLHWLLKSPHEVEISLLNAETSMFTHNAILFIDTSTMLDTTKLIY